MLIIGKFAYDNISLTLAMKKAGGMAVKYAELVDACLACSGAIILQETTTFISIGGKYTEHNITVDYAFWIQHTFNNKLIVKYVLKGPNMPQRVVQQWDFPQQLLEVDMIKAMKNYLKELMPDTKEICPVKVKCNTESSTDESVELKNDLKLNSVNLELNHNLQKTIKQLNIAPGVSVDDKAYAILQKAKVMASKLSSACPTPLSTDGIIEALIYCSVLLVDLREDYANSIDISKLEDKYFLLLNDETIMLSTKEIDDTIGLLNNRISFYKKIVNTLTELDDNSLKKAYYFFFVNPLSVDVNIKEIEGIQMNINISSLRLSLIVTALNQQTEDYINGLPN